MKYRKHRKGRLIGLTLSLLLGLSACGSAGQTQAAQPVEGLEELGKITVVSREEGSGTRSSFAALAGFESGDGDSSDLTTEGAEITNSAEEVLAAVAGDAAAIGYLSAGQLDSSVKTLNINGIDMESAGYPLGRSFYLAYSGQLSDLEQDFLTYVHGAGQEIVGENYGTVAKSGSFLSNKAEGTLTLQGSTSVAPLMEELAADYESRNPNASVTVTATDSTDGLNAAMQGKCNFGMSSRELKDYEQELLDYEAIAQDKIAVVVHPDNPLSDLTLEQLKAIYTGEKTDWADLYDE